MRLTTSMAQLNVLSNLTILPYVVTCNVISILGLPSSNDWTSMSAPLCFSGAILRPTYVLVFDGLLRRFGFEACCGIQVNRPVVGSEVTVTPSNYPQVLGNCSRPVGALERRKRINSDPGCTPLGRNNEAQENSRPQFSQSLLTPIDENFRSVSQTPSATVGRLRMSHVDNSLPASTTARINFRSGDCSPLNLVKFSSHDAWQATDDVGQQTIPSTSSFDSRSSQTSIILPATTMDPPSSDHVTPSHARADSARPELMSSPYKLERFFGEQLRDVDDDNDVTVPESDVNRHQCSIDRVVSNDNNSSVDATSSIFNVTDASYQLMTSRSVSSASNKPTDIRQMPYVV